MKTPAFWHSRNMISTLLLPAAELYRLSLRLKAAQSPQALPVPVICIGNLTAGGAGKTPVALAVGRRLKDKGVAAYFLSRGYGGRLRGPLVVNPHIHTAGEVGDEPLLLAKTLPTVIAKNRLEGARLAVESGAKAIVMDDGFQNLSLAKTLSILVVNGEVGFGNGRLLPAGPLREPVEQGFRRADAVIVIDGMNTLPEIPASLPRMAATLAPTSVKDLQGKSAIAFCGIAYPRRFYRTAEALGANIVSTASFSDHHLYTDGDMQKLVVAARKENALLITTAKDAVRLSPAWRPLVTTVDIALSFKEPGMLDALLNRALGQA